MSIQSAINKALGAGAKIATKVQERKTEIAKLQEKAEKAKERADARRKMIAFQQSKMKSKDDIYFNKTLVAKAGTDRWEELMESLEEKNE